MCIICSIKIFFFLVTGNPGIIIMLLYYDVMNNYVYVIILMCPGRVRGQSLAIVNNYNNEKIRI